MVKYILHYFKSQGRAESSRLAFKLAGIDYEEVNYEAFSAEWTKSKPKYPTQHLPVLEIDGKMIGESKAILRYLGREFGLYGKTSLEAAYIDQVIDVVEDIWAPIELLIVGTKEEVTAKMKNYLTDAIPPVYAALERLIALDVAGDFFVGNSITIADLFFFTAVDMVNVIPRVGNSLEKYPKLTALKSRIAANPKIAAWLKVRPPEMDLESYFGP